MRRTKFKVRYETFRGKPTNLKPMPLTVARQLKAGDKVYLWWAKDGNLRDVRIDGVCEILETTHPDHCPGICLSFDDGDLDICDSDVAQYPDSNSVEWACRGSAYLYYPPEDEA